MPTNEVKKKLAKITQTLISEEVDSGVLKNSIEELKLLLERVSGLNQKGVVNSENIALLAGKAIGPKWAGMCLEDTTRTRKFITGIHKAIQEVLIKNPKKPVTILYAGTGPYATLILPLLSLYKPSELQLILLEVNTISIENLKKIIKGFDAYEYIKAIYHCDASNFIIPSEFDADILLLECMQHALLREPQVDITYNLLPQLKKEAILIPEKISLHLALIDTDKKKEYLSIEDNKSEKDYYENSEAVFTLNKAEILQNSLNFKKESFHFPEKETHFSKEQLGNYDFIAVSTEITIFKNISLEIDESGLTVPLLLADLNYDQNVIGAKTQYIMGTDPGLASQLVRS
ncbi:SAM-dependent methyltransferase [Aequorivita antarctica]|uniref:Phytanoyl-CoA dioxygenase n=1 Tax=Aequorivita antarctica TaxID=153266 RepID=A0A5C6YVX1_9FLAO|nr:hypothetical protein [Aequorivita antarctica]TXD71331.1 hypothetical protein ESU54_17245 [Aequorivita antarctica]SRX76464.1 hypothetical protein AEQU3_03464 [Aequorivita antarctica]